MESLGEVDSIVVGAGVVGLACARALAQSGLEVMVLEAEGGIGEHCSSRNSEVIHAGIYYPPGSLKARLCVEGRQYLYRYLEERGIAHRRVGKLIVAATADECGELENYARRARDNGVEDLRLLDRAEVLAMEPSLDVHGALWSPATGILDSHGYMLGLQGDAEAAGAGLAMRVRVDGVAVEHRGFSLAVVQNAQRYSIRCRRLVNAAGLGAWRLARAIEGFDGDKIPPAHYARGRYMTYSGRVPFRHLIYPLPQQAGLGVHLTLDLAGQARFGPDACWVDEPDYSVDGVRATAFADAIRRYWPGVEPTRLQPGYAGVRPKLSGPGEPGADFLIQGRAQHGVNGLVQLFGIESPGLTASLAIADYVKRDLE